MSKNDKNNAPKKNLGVIVMVWVLAILMVSGGIAAMIAGFMA